MNNRLTYEGEIEWLSNKILRNRYHWNLFWCNFLRP